MEIISMAIGAIAIIMFMLIYSSLSWGFVLLKFYGWFLLPVFTSLPAITYWQAVGLVFFVGLFHNHSTTAVKDEFKDSGKETTIMFIAPWMTLLFGLFINWAFL